MSLCGAVSSLLCPRHQSSPLMCASPTCFSAPCFALMSTHVADAFDVFCQPSRLELALELLWLDIAALCCSGAVRDFWRAARLGMPRQLWLLHCCFQLFLQQSPTVGVRSADCCEGGHKEPGGCVCCHSSEKEAIQGRDALRSCHMLASLLVDTAVLPWSFCLCHTSKACASSATAC